MLWAQTQIILRGYRTHKLVSLEGAVDMTTASAELCGTDEGEPAGFWEVDCCPSWYAVQRAKEQPTLRFRPDLCLVDQTGSEKEASTFF